MIVSGFHRAMDASNQFDFGLDSGMDVYGLGSLGYVEHGMDRGLPIFLFSFPEGFVQQQ